MVVGRGPILLKLERSGFCIQLLLAGVELFAAIFELRIQRIHGIGRDRGSRRSDRRDLVRRDQLEIVQKRREHQSCKRKKCENRHSAVVYVSHRNNYNTRVQGAEDGERYSPVHGAHVSVP